MSTHDLSSFDIFAANADAISRRRRRHVRRAVRAITHRMDRRTVSQRLRALLPRLDIGGLQ